MNLHLSKLYPISQGAFDLLDYSRRDLTAVIAVDGHDDTNEIELSQDDILSAALAFGWIDSFYDPAFDGADYIAQDHDGYRVSFPMWFESLGGTDTDRLFEGAITTRAEMGLKRVSRELFVMREAA